MPSASRINHKMKNQVWVRPEIGYDAWKKINDYARRNQIDFPMAVEEAANLLTGNCHV